jgi:hypothetical protein
MGSRVGTWSLEFIWVFGFEFWNFAHGLENSTLAKCTENAGAYNQHEDDNDEQSKAGEKVCSLFCARFASGRVVLDYSSLCDGRIRCGCDQRRVFHPIRPRGGINSSARVSAGKNQSSCDY